MHWSHSRNERCSGPLYNTLDTDEESETTDIKCGQPSATVTVLQRNDTWSHVASSEHHRGKKLAKLIIFEF